MTLEHGSRSGDLVRARGRHRLPAGSPARRLHPDPGLVAGGGASGRLPVGAEGARAGREADPCRSSVWAHERDVRPARADPGRDRYRLPGRRDPARARDGVVLPRLRRALHERRHDHRRGLPRHGGARRAVLGLRRRDGDLRSLELDVRGRGGRAGRGHRASTRPRRSTSTRVSGSTRAPSGATRRCRIRAASFRSCAATSRATRRRWCARSAASRRRPSSRWPTR